MRGLGAYVSLFLLVFVCLVNRIAGVPRLNCVESLGPLVVFA